MSKHTQIKHTQILERRNSKKNKDNLSNKALAVGMTLAALAVSGHIVKERIDAGAAKNQARIEMQTVNKSQRVVSLDADTTLFGVASLATEKGYLKGDPRDGADFLTQELENQMQASGLLKEGEKVDVGSLQPGTQLRVPASWEGIGQPEPRVEIGTAITGE